MPRSRVYRYSHVLEVVDANPDQQTLVCYFSPDRSVAFFEETAGVMIRGDLARKDLQDLFESGAMRVVGPYKGRPMLARFQVDYDSLSPSLLCYVIYEEGRIFLRPVDVSQDSD